MRDLEEIREGAVEDLIALTGKRLLITGGTGFFGQWLLAALLHANRAMDLRIDLTVLSREPARFLERHPALASQHGLRLIRGSVTDFSSTDVRFDYVVHAATDTIIGSEPNEEEKRSKAIGQGTRQILKFANSCGVSRFLYVSSGAVYGLAAARLTGACEEDSPRPITPYGKAKLLAENLCGDSNVPSVIARAFAFLGPYLPLDAHYAAGNFLRDALRGGPIRVRGDGTAVRTYLYPADLIVWLLRLLIRGQEGAAYNVGSNEVVSTEELAHAIAQLCVPAPEIVIESVQPQGPQNVYLPDIMRAHRELNLTVTIPLREAITRTLEFHRPNAIEVI